MFVHLCQEDYFALRTQEYVMDVDAGGSSRPVVVIVTDPDDINQAFDSITYAKVSLLLEVFARGCCLISTNSQLRMTTP